MLNLAMDSNEQVNHVRKMYYYLTFIFSFINFAVMIDYD